MRCQFRLSSVIFSYNFKQFSYNFIITLYTVDSNLQLTSIKDTKRQKRWYNVGRAMGGFATITS